MVWQFDPILTCHVPKHCCPQAHQTCLHTYNVITLSLASIRTTSRLVIVHAWMQFIWTSGALRVFLTTIWKPLNQGWRGGHGSSTERKHKNRMMKISWLYLYIDVVSMCFLDFFQLLLWCNIPDGVSANQHQCLLAPAPLVPALALNNDFGV